MSSTLRKRSTTSQPDAPDAPAPSPAPSAGPGSSLPRLRTASTAAGPQLPASPPFLLAHVGRYALIAGKILPALATYRIVPGQNGVSARRNRATGEDEYSTDELLMKLARKGAIVIPWEYDVYLYEAAPGCWLSKWERPIPGTSRTVSDLNAYAAWLEKLMDDGIVPRPSEYHLERIRSQAEADRDGAQAGTAAHAAAVRVVEQLDALGGA